MCRPLQSECFLWPKRQYMMATTLWLEISPRKLFDAIGGSGLFFSRSVLVLPYSTGRFDAFADLSGLAPKKYIKISAMRSTVALV